MWRLTASQMRWAFTCKARRWTLVGPLLRIRYNDASTLERVSPICICLAVTHLDFPGSGALHTLIRPNLSAIPSCPCASVATSFSCTTLPLISALDIMRISVTPPAQASSGQNHSKPNPRADPKTAMAATAAMCIRERLNRRFISRLPFQIVGRLQHIVRCLNGL